MSAKAEAAYHPYPVGVRMFETLEQGSDEWLYHRAGIVTTSVVGQLITTKTIKPASNDYSRALTNHLVAERITGFVEPMHISMDMERGNLDEPIARDLYSEHFAPVHEVGFMIRDYKGYKIGYSPDGLVNDDGLIEIKSRRQKKHLATILTDEVPPENVAQLQTGLYVSGRQWIDYLSWCGGMPMYRKRVYPDLRWFTAIEQALEIFETNAADMIARYDERIKGLPLTERTDHFADMEMSY